MNNYFEDDQDVPSWKESEWKEDWQARKDDLESWQSQLDEEQEEAIYFGELQKSAKDLNVLLPDGYSIEVDYNEMSKPRVSVIGPHGVLVDSDGH